ncbi:hypothetical protein MON38_20320 [Hymenobacter sp. DH14]|uniref:Outer membrane protein beta-barrel domain-containing protein n=1 Tax=Hymenobacter cyanobacteriorum TaxID=2926463 RepID=A0A9X2AJG9_9BACT|nr:hypothetical protein [Hymenobacter cyanobacteriorum]MCI1189775.1 hypothetical protein [Hymenobacter cyanobacteriorum]
MKPKSFLLPAICGCWFSTFSAQAQCHSHAPVFTAHHAFRSSKDSCAVQKPFQPSRFGAYIGVLGLRDRRGTPFAGLDLEGSYYLTPRWGSGLRATLTGQMPAGALPVAHYGESVRPSLQMFSATWSNSLLLLDQPRWRVAVLGGAGVGWLNLRDRNQQVPSQSSTYRSCGCTESKLLETAASPLTEVGLSATYKLKGKNAPWLTMRGQYRQWYGTVPFGTPNQFSHYLLSVGVSLPDAPRRSR